MTETNLSQEQIVERMSYRYPEGLGDAEKACIDEARATVADAMIWSYSRFMSELPASAKEDITKYRKSSPLSYAGVKFPELAFPNRVRGLLGDKPDVTLEDLFDAATDEACYLASIRTIAYLEKLHAGSFSKVFLTKGYYPSGSTWEFHTYFILECKLGSDDAGKDKVWYFAGSPANGRHYRDPLKLYESGDLNELMVEINRDEGNVFPSGEEIGSVFWRYGYKPPDLSVHRSSQDFIQPRVFVVRKNPDKDVYYQYEYEKETIYFGQKEYKKL